MTIVATALVSGSREVTDAHRPIVADGITAIARLLGESASIYPPVRTFGLRQGGATGADAAFATAAGATGRFEIIEHPAQWNTHVFDAAEFTDDQRRAGAAPCPEPHHGQERCRMAGHRRNAIMASHRDNLLLAMPMHPRTATAGSRGTWGQIAAGKALDIPTFVLWGPNPALPARLFWTNEGARELIYRALPDGHPYSDRDHPQAQVSMDLLAFIDEPPF